MVAHCYLLFSHFYCVPEVPIRLHSSLAFLKSFSPLSLRFPLYLLLSYPHSFTISFPLLSPTFPLSYFPLPLTSFPPSFPLSLPSFLMPLPSLSHILSPPFHHLPSIFTLPFPCLYPAFPLPLPCLSPSHWPPLSFSFPFPFSVIITSIKLLRILPTIACYLNLSYP